MLLVVPGAEVDAEGARVFQLAEPVGEVRPILQRPEVRLAVWVMWRAT
jgi:hypothetical protein